MSFRRNHCRFELFGTLSLLALCSSAIAQEPKMAYLPESGGPVADQEAPAPPHWYDRHSLDAPPPVPEMPHHEPWSLGELFLRIDGGSHKEPGFPSREGAGFKLTAVSAFRMLPWFSFIGELRNEILTQSSDRLSWTIGGLSEVGPWQFALGVDGIYDSYSSSHVGSVFFLLSYEFERTQSRIGLWTTARLWDDVRTQWVDQGGGFFEVTTRGVIPAEETSIFYAAKLGPDGRWGEVYVAPGIDHLCNDFCLSAGYQVNIIENLDGFVQYHQTFGNIHEYSIFAGIQLQLGGSSNRPWDFVMPNRIRARERRGSSSEVVFSP